MQDLIQQVEDFTDALMDELAVCKTSGCQLADNERDYRVALRVAILEERDRGTPVTIIGDVCRGRPDIADKKRLRDCSEAIYKASQEAINVYKLRLRMIDQQMNREWHSGNVTQGGYLL